VASLSQGRTAAAQCGLFTYKSVPVIFEPPCITDIYHCILFDPTGTNITRFLGFFYNKPRIIDILALFAPESYS